MGKHRGVRVGMGTPGDGTQATHLGSFAFLLDRWFARTAVLACLHKHWQADVIGTHILYIGPHILYRDTYYIGTHILLFKHTVDRDTHITLYTSIYIGTHILFRIQIVYSTIVYGTHNIELYIGTHYHCTQGHTFYCIYRDKRIIVYRDTHIREHSHERKREHSHWRKREHSRERKRGYSHSAQISEKRVGYSFGISVYKALGLYLDFRKKGRLFFWYRGI